MQKALATEWCEFVSARPREECVRRLRLQTSRWAWPPLGRKRVAGRVGEASLQLCKRIWYQNSFQTLMRGVLIGEDGGTRVLCCFGVLPFVTAILWFGLGFILLWAGIFTIAAVASLLMHGGPVQGIAWRVLHFRR